MSKPTIAIDSSGNVTPLSSLTMPAEESDRLIIRPLGAGQEVGRSCCLLEYKNKRILFDCGIHPGRQGHDALPIFECCDPETIDLLLITHFHLDHCGALPWFFKNTNFKGKCYMTHPTKAIYRWLLADFIRVSHLAVDDLLFTEQDVEKSMSRIITVDFHQQVEVDGIKFSSYQAGHVLGAAMFVVEIAGVRVLYTGDFSCEEDRHLMAAEIPPTRPHVAVVEATYGTHVHDARDQRESRFTGLVHNIINRGGRCLVPVFALGRTQELLLILDEYWSSHPELQDVPVYYASQLAKKCLQVYQTFTHAMNDRMRRQLAAGTNPFVFKHIASIRSSEQLDDAGPCVVLASPGMLQSGLSRELFEKWCPDSRNGCIIAGYCVEGTLAKSILSNPQEIPAMGGGGTMLPMRCSVDYVSFSAHTDFTSTSNFLAEVRPPHVVLVHGEATEMARLKAALDRQQEDSSTAAAAAANADNQTTTASQRQMRIYTPKNTQAVEFRFRGEKLAKVAGKLAEKPPQAGERISGIAVKRNYRLTIVDPSELHSTAGLHTANVKQRITVPFNSCQIEAFHAALKQMTGDVQFSSKEPKDGDAAHNPLIQFRLFCDSLLVTFIDNGKKSKGEEDNEDTPVDGYFLIEWDSGPVGDMLADAAIAVATALMASGVTKCPEADLPSDAESVVRDFIAAATLDNDDIKLEGKVISALGKNADVELPAAIAPASKNLASAVSPLLLETFGYFCHPH